MSDQLMDWHYDTIVSYARLFPRSVCECTHVCLHNCLCGMGIAGVMTSRCIDKTVHQVSEGGVGCLGVSLSYLEP